MSLWTVFCQVAGLNRLFPDSPFFHSEGYGGWQRDTEREVDIVTGCFLLLRRETWEDLGGFDLSFVMYGEEADLCLRARQIGARPWVTPDAAIVHFGGASEKVRADKMVRLFKAKIRLIRKHLPAWQQPLAVGLFRLWPWTRLTALRLLGRGRGQPARIWAEIWSRRAEWQGGWPDIDAANS